MAKEYLLSRKEIERSGKEVDNPFAGFVIYDGDFIVSREEFVGFNGKRVLVWQSVAQKFGLKDWVAVAGYVVSDIYLNNFGCEAVKCEPVPSEDREGLTAILLERKFSGVINFNS